MPVSTPDLSSFSKDVLRTSPDYVAYVPKGGAANDWTNQHFLVVSVVERGVPGGVDDGDVRGQAGPARGVCAQRRRRGDVERAAGGGWSFGR